MHAVHRGRSSKQTSADDVDGHECAGRGSEAEDVAYSGERPKPVSSEATTGAAFGGSGFFVKALLILNSPNRLV